MSITDRLYNKLAEKMSTQLGYRGDLFVADHRGINKNATKLLVGFNNSLGQPTKTDVTKFIVSTFDGRVSPRTETARIYPDIGAVSLVLSKVRPTRSYQDSKKMIAIASTLFLDETIGDKWEVQKNGDQIFLARIDEEDISDIVSNRMQRMQIKASVVTFDNLKGQRCVASAQVGDTVKFFDSNEVKEGVIVSIGPVKATIRVKGNIVAIDPVAIFEVVKVGTSAKKDTTDILYDYYKKAYPENYGDMYIDLYKKS